MKKYGILVVSIGTASEDAEEKSIFALEKKIVEMYPDRQVFQAYSSLKVRQLLVGRGRQILSVKEALREMLAKGITHCVILPTYLIYGEEYEKLVQAVETEKKNFSEIVIAKPLAADREDRDYIAHMLRKVYVQQPDTAIVMMGHGTCQSGNAAYEEMQNVCKESGYEDIYIGTVKSYPSIDAIIQKLSDACVKKVILLPFLFVAGSHVRRDMIGEHPNSWRRQLEQQGIEVTAVLKGLGEYEEIRTLYCKHLQEIEQKQLTNVRN